MPNSISRRDRPLRRTAALLGALLATAAHANDGYAELGIGGIVTPGKTQRVSMVREVLEVRPDRIRVDYVFERRGDSALPPIPVLFPLPLYGAELPSATWAGSPRGFSATVDGRPVPYRALVKGRQGDCGDVAPARSCTADVTEALRSAGVSDEQIAHYPLASPFFSRPGERLRVPPLTPKQTRQLLRQGLVVEEGPSEERPYPAWLADVSYVWEMNFGDRRRIEVSHQYVPFTSGGSNSYYFTEALLRKEYCADDAQIAAWQRLVSAASPAPEAYGPVAGSRVEYILTTANSWGGPIRDFTLRLRKAKASELVMLCFPGKFRRADPLTLEVHLEDFEPRDELRVLFLNVDPAVAGTEGPNGLPPMSRLPARTER